MSIKNALKLFYVGLPRIGCNKSVSFGSIYREIDLSSFSIVKMMDSTNFLIYFFKSSSFLSNMHYGISLHQNIFLGVRAAATAKDIGARKGY